MSKILLGTHNHKLTGLIFSGITKILLQKISGSALDTKMPSMPSMLNNAIGWTRRNAKSATANKENPASAGVAAAEGDFEDDGQARAEFINRTLPFLVDNEGFTWLVKWIQAILVQTRGE